MITTAEEVEYGESDYWDKRYKQFAFKVHPSIRLNKHQTDLHLKGL